MEQVRHALVTGGAGFIGSHVVDRLLAEGGWQVTVLDNFEPNYDRAVKERNIAKHRNDPRFRALECDLLAPELEEQLADTPFDVIVHLAAKVGVRTSMLDPVRYHRVNVTGTLRLLELARRNKVPRFVLASSSSVYGENRNVPWRESERTLVPISPYAATKLAAEQFAQVHAGLHGIQVTTLRFFTVYGPRQRPEMAIHQFFRSMRAGEPIPVFGDGASGRDYTYVDDIVSGIRAAMERERGGLHEIYNLGNSEVVRLDALIAAIEAEIGLKARVERRPMERADVPCTYADLTKAAQDLGYRPAVTLRSGLARFHDWLRSEPVLIP